MPVFLSFASSICTSTCGRNFIIFDCRPNSLNSGFSKINCIWLHQMRWPFNGLKPANETSQSKNGPWKGNTQSSRSKAFEYCWGFEKLSQASSELELQHGFRRFILFNGSITLTRQNQDSGKPHLYTRLPKTKRMVANEGEYDTAWWVVRFSTNFLYLKTSGTTTQHRFESMDLHGIIWQDPSQSWLPRRRYSSLPSWAPLTTQRTDERSLSNLSWLPNHDPFFGMLNKHTVSKRVGYTPHPRFQSPNKLTTHSEF